MNRLLLNPSAGTGRAARLPDLLRPFAKLDVRTPGSAAAVFDEARSAAAEGVDRLLVAGGDGTLHHAISGLAGSNCALGVVPFGSGNDLARALGVPLDPLRAARQALEASPRRIDLGRIDGRPFAGVASLGFDAEVARFARDHVRTHRGRWIYPYAVARTLLTFRPFSVRIDLEEQRYEGRVMLVAVANSPFYGGGMRIAPAAQLDDDWLDLVIIEQVPRARFLMLFPRVYRGAHVDDSAVRVLRTRRATLQFDRSLSVFADGEPFGACSTAQAEIWPAALRVVA